MTSTISTLESVLREMIDATRGSDDADTRAARASALETLGLEACSRCDDAVRPGDVLYRSRHGTGLCPDCARWREDVIADAILDARSER